MGFGSYEEDGGDQQANEDDVDGEAVTKDGASEDGEESIEDEDVDGMMGHL